MGDLARLMAKAHGLGWALSGERGDADEVRDRYVGDGRIMEELAVESALSLGPLPVLIRQTSDWLTGGSEEHATP